MEELLWIAATKTTDVQTNQKHRVAFYYQGFNKVIKFERLDDKDGRKSYTTLAEVVIGEIGNSGFEHFFSTAISKINAIRQDDNETKYNEVLLNHFEQGKLTILRFSYSIAAGQKSDYKRARTAFLKIYSFGNYQEAKPYMTRGQNGAFDQLPETNCVYTLNLKLMPKLVTSGTGKTMTEGESFLQDLHVLICALRSVDVLARSFNHLTSEDAKYKESRNQYSQSAVQTVATTAEAQGTNIQVAVPDAEEEFPF